MSRWLFTHVHSECIKQLGGILPGSADVVLGKPKHLPADTADVVWVIEAVIDAEDGAFAQCQRIISSVEGSDHVTRDLCIRLLAGEQ